MKTSWTEELIISEPTDLRKKSIEYFEKSGFKLIDKNSNETTVTFRRGSIASNFWTYNPLNWKSEINIEINGKEVKVNININRIGQIPTNKDELLWEIFIDNFQKYLLDSNFDFMTENSKTLKTTKSKNLKYFGWALIGGILGLIPTGLLAYWSGIDITSIGAASGAFALMIKKIIDDKKNNVE